MARMTAKDWFVTFVLVVIVISLVVLGWQIETRTEAIQAINEAATRIEIVASNTEQILIDAIADRNSPERQQFNAEVRAANAEVRAALDEISEIKTLLCETEMGQESTVCPPTG